MLTFQQRAWRNSSCMSEPNPLHGVLLVCCKVCTNLIAAAGGRVGIGPVCLQNIPLTAVAVTDIA